jgi:hypothetical protein
MAYIALRDTNGKIVARYDPSTETLEIVARGTISTFDLRSLRTQEGLTPPTPPAHLIAADRRPARRR